MLRFEERDARRFRMKVAVLAALFDQDQVLLLRRFNTGEDDSRFVLPMGCIEEGESASEALIRESREEIGIVPTRFEVIHVSHRLHHRPDGVSFPQVDVYFGIYAYDGEITNCEPHKCDLLAFYPRDALPEETAPFIKATLDSIAAKHSYSEFGWPSS